MPALQQVEAQEERRKGGIHQGECLAVEQWSGDLLLQSRLCALRSGSAGCSEGGLTSSRYSMITADSNSTVSPTLSRGTLPSGEMALNHSGGSFRLM